MLTEEETRRAVEQLVAADHEHVAATRLSWLHPDTQPADAYRVARQLQDRRIRAGDPVVGYKTGLTSQAAQQAVGIHEPDYGVVLASMLADTGATFHRSQLFSPAVEPELAFVLESPLQGPGVDVDLVLAATDYIVPSLEIVDSRYERPVRLVDSIADNAAAAALVRGTVTAGPYEYDLAGVRATITLGDQTATGYGSAVMGNPAAAVAWLANKLAEFDVAIQPGQIVLSGSMTPFLFVESDGEARADYGALGVVTAHFVSD